MIRLINNYLHVFFILFFVLLTNSVKSESNHSTYKAEQISIILNNLSQYGAVGSVVGYSSERSNLIQQYSGFTDRSRKISMDEAQLFQIGSQSKMFTAGAILLLEKSGKLSLKDNVQNILPELVGYPPITIKQLLSHTSGIGDSINLFDSPNQPPSFNISFEDHLMIGRSYGQQFIAGEKWQYNNLGFVILGKIVERVSGKKFNIFLRDKILEPLLMTNTFVGNQEKWPAKRMSSGYHKDRNQKLINDSKPELSWASHAGDMISNTEDMHKWFRALVTKNNAINLYLSDFTKYSVPTERPGALEKYGLGIMKRNINGTHMWGHGGFIHGYISMTLIEPLTNNIVSIMINVDDDSDDLFINLEATIALVYHLNAINLTE